MPQTRWQKAGLWREKETRRRKELFAGSGQDPPKGYDGSSLLFSNHYRDQVNKLEVTSVLPDNSPAGATDLIQVLLHAISDQRECLSLIFDGLQELL